MHPSRCPLVALAAVSLLAATRPLRAQHAPYASAHPPSRLAPVPAGVVRRQAAGGISHLAWSRRRRGPRTDPERERRRTRWLVAGAMFGAGAGFAIGYARAEVPDDAFVGYQKWTGGAQGAVVGAAAGAFLAAGGLWVTRQW